MVESSWRIEWSPPSPASLVTIAAISSIAGRTGRRGRAYGFACRSSRRAASRGGPMPRMPELVVLRRAVVRDHAEVRQDRPSAARQARRLGRRFRLAVAAPVAAEREQPAGHEQCDHQPGNPCRDKPAPPVDTAPRLLAPAPPRLVLHPREVWPKLRLAASAARASRPAGTDIELKALLGLYVGRVDLREVEPDAGDPGSSRQWLPYSGSRIVTRPAGRPQAVRRRASSAARAVGRDVEQRAPPACRSRTPSNTYGTRT